MSAAELIYLLNLASTLYLCGLIWFVQIVHYPLFSKVPRPAGTAYAREHQRRTAWVVVVPMVAEAGTGFALGVWRPPGFTMIASLTGVAAIVVIWLSTFGLQVPEHRRLAAGFDTRAHRRLVGSNWIRTVAWSLRAVLLLAFVPAVFRAA